MCIVLFVQKNKKVSAGDISDAFEIHPKTAQRKLHDLINIGVLIKTGEKKGTKYCINPEVNI